MRKLQVPAYDPIDVYDVCVSEVTDTAMKNVYEVERSHIVSAYQDFDQATANVAWAQLPRASWGHPKQIVAGSLTKKDLTILYSDYMVGSDDVAREIYDELLVANGGTCAFCGGLGQVKTLDHYLPKSNFPQYSVHPANLIPCCRDCNTGKGSTFGHGVNDQVVHPYLDDQKFFTQRWVIAEISLSDPLVVKYSCMPPANWSEIDADRVKRHFADYDIAARFSVQAGAELIEVINLRVKSLKVLSFDDFRGYLIDHAESAGLDLNGWSRTMYKALAETKWFCEADFTDPVWLLHTTR